MAEKDGFGSFLAGFLIGGIAGAVVALLYAPSTGEETRTVIKDKAIELKDKTTDSLDEVYKKVESVATDSAKQATELYKQVQEKGTELYKQAQEKGSEVLKKRQVVLENEKAPAKPKKSEA